jgi:hypothetical protein
MPDFSDKKTLEKFSSVFTLSDMEIFVFPELLYPLVLANIMSPVIWTWRDDPWFKDIHKKTFKSKVNRIKQYIIDHFVFNLDLDTWGLTKKDIEISRFKDFMDMNTLKQSNALFGYEGDKYYFDIDIRRHFGLDKYSGDTIPYWKTETVEAMNAFRYKESFVEGAGECVSFSALYAAALFVVGRIPLENIFIIGTPLHSQNFINFLDGVLTNNRRIVTRTMWFNGTAMTAKARRALEKEKVTMVSHISGYIHLMYEKATINKALFEDFSKKLKEFLKSDFSPSVFINFLRYHMNFKKCFQYRHYRNAHNFYIALETIFEYEHNTKYSFSENSRELLLNEIDSEEFSLTPIENRILFQDMEDYFKNNKVTSAEDIIKYLSERTEATKCNNEENLKLLIRDLTNFLNVEPKLPDLNKQFVNEAKLNIEAGMSREEILKFIIDKSPENELALLSLYAYRQMDRIDWKPFIKAALERNPVSLEGLKGNTSEMVFQLLNNMPNFSIYDSLRLAQPDEVWNYGRGDGVEKALVLANFLYNDMNEKNLELVVENKNVVLISESKNYIYTSEKNLVKRINLIPV